jgi:hypothetical protein
MGAVASLGSVHLQLNILVLAAHDAVPGGLRLRPTTGAPIYHQHGSGVGSRPTTDKVG